MLLYAPRGGVLSPESPALQCAECEEHACGRELATVCSKWGLASSRVRVRKLRRNQVSAHSMR